MKKIYKNANELILNIIGICKACEEYDLKEDSSSGEKILGEIDAFDKNLLKLKEDLVFFVKDIESYSDMSVCTDEDGLIIRNSPFFNI